MLKVLIVDDEQAKADHIKGVVSDILGAGVSISIAASYVGACVEMERMQFDLVILDLRLPRDDGSTADTLMGAEILDRLSDASHRFLQPRHLVGLTAFDDLHGDFVRRFEDEGWHLLQYSDASNEWRQRLARIIVHASASEQAATEDETAYRTDIVIITALTHTEQEQVLALPLGWSKMSNVEDDTVYYSGCLRTARGDKSVITASAVRMGMPATTAMSMKMICRFRPRFIAMCGIAAGVRGNFGDILIADQVWDYGSGKNIAGIFGTSRFEPAPESIPLDHYLRSRLAEFRTRDSVLDEIREGWSQQKFGKLSAQIGPVASGAAVLQNRWMIDNIKKGQRKLIGIEMEAYGLFMASEIAPHPKPKAFAVKSICDFGDHRKGDHYQSYAAYTSACFIHRFAEEYL